METLQQYNLRMVANQPEFKIGDLVMYEKMDVDCPEKTVYIVQDVITGARWIPFDDIESDLEPGEATGFWRYKVSMYEDDWDGYEYFDSEELQLIP